MLPIFLCYIGHTRNELGDRIGQHQVDVKKSNDDDAEVKSGEKPVIFKMETSWIFKMR